VTMADSCGDLDETIRTYDRIAAEFADRTWRLPLDAMREAFLAPLEARRPGRPLRILDAGCGPGRDAAWFRARRHWVVGADLSQGMLAEARRRVPGGTFVRMDLRTPSFAPRRFDAVWLCAALLHVPKAEWPPTLRRYHALLDGGRLFLSVKHGDGERLVPGAGEAKGGRFFSYATEAELTALLDDAGFRLLHQSRRPGEPGHDWLAVHAEPR
jgi:SAM-dependent methyltransferase